MPWASRTCRLDWFATVVYYFGILQWHNTVARHTKFLKFRSKCSQYEAARKLPQLPTDAISAKVLPLHYRAYSVSFIG